MASHLLTKFMIHLITNKHLPLRQIGGGSHRRYLQDKELMATKKTNTCLVDGAAIKLRRPQGMATSFMLAKSSDGHKWGFRGRMCTGRSRANLLKVTKHDYQSSEGRNEYVGRSDKCGRPNWRKYALEAIIKLLFIFPYIMINVYCSC